MEDAETKRRGRPPGSGNARVEALVTGAPMPTEDTIPMRVVRDFWDDAGERVTAGSIVRVSVKAALRGVKHGSLDLVED